MTPEDAMTLGQLADAIDRLIGDLGRGASVRATDEQTAANDSIGRIVAARPIGRDLLLVVRGVDPRD